MRSLIYIPSYHSRAEIAGGSRIQDSLKQSSPAVAANQDRLRLVLWNSIDRGITKYGEDFSGVKLFAEGEQRTSPSGFKGDFAGNYQAMKFHFQVGDPVLEQRQSALVEALWLAGATPIRIEDALIHELTVKSVKMLGAAVQEGVREEELIKYYQTFQKTMQLRNMWWDEQVPQIIDSNLEENDRGVFVAGVGHYKPILNLPSDIQIEFISPEAERLWRIVKEGINPHSPEGVQRFFESGPTESSSEISRS